MAPRGRPRRVGLKRIDAAIDALTPLGFPRDVIRETINELLKVYDGDAGWVFIEEASYKLVIESILEQQEKNRVEEEGEASQEEGEASQELQGAQISEPVLETGEMRSQQSQREGSTILLHPGEMEAQPTMTSNGGAINVQQQHNEPPRQRRPPCYGWISESESEDEEDYPHDPYPPQNQQMIERSQEPLDDVGGLHRERRRPSRWDIRGP